MMEPEESRPCNGLESFFVQHNIRFVIGLSFPPQPMERVLQATQQTFANGTCVVVASASASTDRPPRLIARWNAQWRQLKPIIETLADENQTLRTTVKHAVVTYCPADGPGSFFLYKDHHDSSSTMIVQAVWNFNHALVDAIGAQALLKYFFQCLASSTVQSQKPPPPLSMDDWIHPVQSSLKALKRPSDETPFLPWHQESAIIRLRDFLGKDEEASHQDSEDTIICLSNDIVKQCLFLAKQKGTTLTGIWMACLVCTIAQSYFETTATTTIADSSSSCCIAVSVLVDLRRFFPPNQRQRFQVMASVTVASVVTKEDLSSFDDNIDGISTAFLWNLATCLMEDVQRRILRGEAHRQAIAMARGDLQDNVTSLEATFELSNHGIYQVPAGCHVELSQRFDEYEGWSVMIHSVGDNGTCIGTSSPGRDLDATKVAALFSRVESLLHLVATDARHVSS